MNLLQDNLQSSIDSVHKPAVLCFPMVYCNGNLHLGHLHVLTQLSARAYLSENPTLIFPYHVSGLPAVLFYEKLINRDETALTQFKQFTKLEFETSNVKCIQDWFKLVRTINDKSLVQFDFPVQLQHTHYTAYVEPMYDCMVEAIFQILQQKNLIYSGIYPVLYCSNCDTVVGDHDLSRGQSVTILNKSLRFEFLNGVYYFCKNGTLYYNKTLEQNWLLNSLLYNSFKDIYELVARYQQTLETFNPNKQMEKNVLSITAYCRCGTHISIKQVLQSFITYNNETWKNITKQYINGMKLNPQTVVQLLNRVDSLRGWPVLRNRGIGTKFRGKVIDSLSDSTLFPIYSILKPFIDTVKTQVNKQFWKNFFLKHNTPVVQATRQYFKQYMNYYWIQASGKDLINNHLTFIIYFMALFEFPYHEVIVTGHVLNEGEKMSKSLNNVITVSSLKDTLNGTQLRYLLLTLAESEQDGNWTTLHVKQGLQNLQKLIKLYETIKTKTVQQDIFDEIFNYKLDELINKTTEVIVNNKFRYFYHLLNTFINKNIYWINALNGCKTVENLTYLLNLALSLIGEVHLQYRLRVQHTEPTQVYKFWSIAQALKRDLYKFLKLKKPIKLDIFYSKTVYNIYQPYLKSSLFENELYNSFKIPIKLELAPVESIRPIFSIAPSK